MQKKMCYAVKGKRGGREITVGFEQDLTAHIITT